MKRSLLLMVAFLAAAASLIADDDFILEEARRRVSEKLEELGITEQALAEKGDEARNEKKPEKPSVYLPIALSLLPGSPLPGVSVDATLGFGLIISVLDDVGGLQMSSIGSVANGSVNGCQGAGIFSTTNGRVNGFQGAGIFSTANGSVNGFQSGGIFSVANGSVNGGQAAGIFAVSEGIFSGFQAAGIFTVKNQGGGPVQLGGIFNISEGKAYGIQGAGIFNKAHDIDGFQAAGIFNVARRVRGLQIGLVNIADSVQGFQIGLVNIVVNGISDTGAWIDDSDFVYAFSQRGSEHFYNLIYAGRPRDIWFDESQSFIVGLGAGTRIGSAKAWQPQLDIDLSAKMEISVDQITNALQAWTLFKAEAFPSLRVSLRMPLSNMLAIHAGCLCDIEIMGYASVPELFREDDAFTKRLFDRDVVFHPKFFVGVSL